MKEKYKLYLSWDKVEYKSDNQIYLHSPKFFGPALKDTQKISDNDSINLDLTLQYVVSIGSWDTSVLKWNKVLKQSQIEVAFDYAIIESGQITKVKYLSDNDYILIDTEKHEEAVHRFNLLYDAVILKNDKEPYQTIKR